jgi:hypothetical protein
LPNPIHSELIVRRAFSVLFLIGALNAGPAPACDIADKQELDVAGRKGLEGKCPNNGHTVICLAEGSGAIGTTSVVCHGPGGKYNGSDLQILISAACGCGVDSVKEISKLRQDPGK